MKWHLIFQSNPILEKQSAWKGYHIHYIGQVERSRKQHKVLHYILHPLCHEINNYLLDCQLPDHNIPSIMLTSLLFFIGKKLSKSCRIKCVLNETQTVISGNFKCINRFSGCFIDPLRAKWFVYSKTSKK